MYEFSSSCSVLVMCKYILSTGIWAWYLSCWSKTTDIYRVTHKQHLSLRLPPYSNVLKIVKTCDDHGRNVVYIFLGTGQGHNSIYLYTNSLAKQKVTHFRFTLAVTKNCSAPFVSSCISCSHWILRILYLGTSQPGSRYMSSLTNTSKSNVWTVYCSIIMFDEQQSIATNWPYDYVASDYNIF